MNRAERVRQSNVPRNQPWSTIAYDSRPTLKKRQPLRFRTPQGGGIKHCQPRLHSIRAGTLNNDRRANPLSEGDMCQLDFGRRHHGRFEVDSFADARVRHHVK
jgi:hypothetical protein